MAKHVFCMNQEIYIINQSLTLSMTLCILLHIYLRAVSQQACDMPIGENGGIFFVTKLTFSDLLSRCVCRTRV